MVLGDDNKPPQPPVFASPDDLIGVEALWRQKRRGFVAVPPLAVGIGIEAPVDNAVDVNSLIQPLDKNGSRARRRWRSPRIRRDTDDRTGSRHQDSSQAPFLHRTNNAMPP